MKEEILERESDAPENWEYEVVLQRDGRGLLLTVEAPDDEEVTDDAGDNQA